MILKKSNFCDVEKLTEISIKSFSTDVSADGTENDGPPDYDSVEWHKKMMQENHLYTYLNDENTIVGGAVLFENSERKELFVGRIFIDPAFFRRGYGMAMMNDIEKMYKSKKIKLDTPIWNERTNRFYKKCGYAEIRRNSESVYYEKIRK